MLVMKLYFTFESKGKIGKIGKIGKLFSMLTNKLGSQNKNWFLQYFNKFHLHVPFLLFLLDVFVTLELFNFWSTFFKYLSLFGCEIYFPLKKKKNHVKDNFYLQKSHHQQQKNKYRTKKTQTKPMEIQGKLILTLDHVFLKPGWKLQQMSLLAKMLFCFEV